jgi:hypothetical protein
MNSFSGAKPVIKIYIPYLLDVFSSIEKLERIKTEECAYMDVFSDFYGAQSSLESLYNTSVFAPYLRSSAYLSNELLKLVKGQNTDFDMKRRVPFYMMHSIQAKAKEYKIALIAELGVFDSYFVTKKGAFDTNSLLNGGESIFPPDLVKKVPEALFDAREAAKSLAYELPTAAGFHTFRATESVVRKYYYHVTGGGAAPKVRNLGVYLNALKQAGKGDPKVLGALKQMADLHRNPTIHPETVLTVDEAIAILGIAQSVVSTMLVRLPDVPPTTSSNQSSLGF